MLLSHEWMECGEWSGGGGLRVMSVSSVVGLGAAGRAFRTAVITTSSGWRLCILSAHRAALIGSVASGGGYSVACALPGVACLAVIPVERVLCHGIHMLDRESL